MKRKRTGIEPGEKKEEERNPYHLCPFFFVLIVKKCKTPTHKQTREK